MQWMLKSRKVQEELISDKEFEKIRNQKENDFISGNSQMAGIAESFSQLPCLLW